ncbi:MotA/TolQ/ExbB proton channel family protein [Ideonella sp.]|uniref:MotA/TolQ/ExbB proton channel family protein n=1 Tax=Ideonella sp. TaxID=1929293 RepID=UPI002B467350|nr:MotA/TolQ/ExbB proton channel family protein [Ideonella sp.]HJV72206.1 MotA/TolQ/ExbB proton channel family protein [Ideonella sp.]
MEGLQGFWFQSDAIGRTVALMLLLMSIGAWVLIFWKTWVLHRARVDLQRGIDAFWNAPDRQAARERLAALDREGVITPLAEAAFIQPGSGTLQTHGAIESQLTRRLRDALHAGLAHLQMGQVFLASVGATAPFVGLFGTVWGIYHALLGIATAGGITIEKVAGPVGEALVMTAAGLAVAIPAVLAYNVFGKWLGACEAELEGFAHDLREIALHND